MSVNEKMTAIADAIRDKTGGTDALTLDCMAEAVPAVYESGQKAEYDRFWDVAQNYGNITYMPYHFAGRVWTDETFKPKYDIKPVGSANGLFRESRILNLKQCLESSGVILDLSNVTNATYIFSYCSLLKVVGKTDISSATTAGALCQSSSALETIEELRIGENTAFSNTSFNGCTSLTRLIMTGTLATNGLDLHWSPLDKESLLSVVNALQNKTSAGGTWTVTLGSDNLAKLTDAEKAIATQKGWTLV